MDEFLLNVRTIMYTTRCHHDSWPSLSDEGLPLPAETRQGFFFNGFIAEAERYGTEKEANEVVTRLKQNRK